MWFMHGEILNARSETSQIDLKLEWPVVKFRLLEHKIFLIL